MLKFQVGFTFFFIYLHNDKVLQRTFIFIWSEKNKGIFIVGGKKANPSPSPVQFIIVNKSNTVLKNKSYKSLTRSLWGKQMEHYIVWMDYRSPFNKDGNSPK
jgi:hypothetical protein